MDITSPLVSRPLGNNGPIVPRLGLGLLSLGMPGQSDEERLAFLDAAFERGERFWDTGTHEIR